jgi:small subunit ribosomal protein S16
MLKMRLQRIGRKNNPAYRVIVTDSRNAAKRGRLVDHIGSYEPKKGVFTVDADKARHWISKGVQVSDTVYNFLVSQKVIEGKKRNALPKKAPIIDEAKIKAEADAKAKAEEEARAQADAAVAAEAAPAEETPATEEVAAVPAEEEPAA